MFTPKDLQEISFAKTRFGGYDMHAVDEILEPLCQDYTKLYKENSVLKSKLKILVEKLEEYRTQEISVKQALVAAQQTSESIVAEAQKKAACILNDAEATAAVQQREASLDQEIALERERLEQAKAEAADFIDALEQDIRKHLELLDALKARVAEEAPAAAVETAAEVISEEKLTVAAETVVVAEQADDSLEVTEEMDDVDLISAISGAVQEIAGAPKAANIHFDDLQFGKDYSFDK